MTRVTVAITLLGRAAPSASAIAAPAGPVRPAPLADAAFRWDGARARTRVFRNDRPRGRIALATALLRRRLSDGAAARTGAVGVSLTDPGLVGRVGIVPARVPSGPTCNRRRMRQITEV